MSQYTVRSATAFAVAALVAVAACGGDKEVEDTRDLNVPEAAPAQPELQDVPVAQAPAPAATPTRAPAPRPTPARPTQTTPAPTPAPVPAPTPAPARAEYGEIAAGSTVVVRTAAQACTDTHKVGDRFTASVAETVSGSEGVSIPAGATATLQVTESVRGENDKNKVKFGFRVVSFTFGGNTYDVVGADVVTPPVETVLRQTSGDQAKKVAAGAAIGAIAGQVLGRNTRSTVVGGAVGAAAGAVASNATADYDGCVKADSRLTVRLAQGLKIRLAAGE